MSKKSIDIAVGTFVVLGLAGLLFIALKAANLTSFNRTDGYELVARFDNIGGLKVRAPVRSAGVVVGHVRKIRLDNKTYQGLVTLRIDGGLRFPKDTAAKILTSGLLGDQYVGLEPGGAEADLGPGEVISLTQSAVVLENLIGQFLVGKAAEVGADAGAKK
jgi:phospholipid/cholesterol/gamma-HCH transport system substrate-binding protein